MRTIGLVGGMSWESSLLYYKLINERVRERLGGLHSADVLMYSIDFAPLEVLQHEGRWAEAGELLAEAALRLERGGAAFVLLCTNTMHKVADAVRARTRLPLLHVADVVGKAVAARGLRRVALLGTRFTMEEPFYRERLAREFSVEAIIPDDGEREVVHRIIYDELCLGRIEAASRQKLVAIVEKLAGNGARGVILGCTELGMILSDGDVTVPIFDSTRLHADAAVDEALK